MQAHEACINTASQALLNVAFDNHVHCLWSLAEVSTVLADHVQAALALKHQVTHMHDPAEGVVCLTWEKLTLFK